MVSKGNTIKRGYLMKIVSKTPVFVIICKQPGLKPCIIVYYKT